MNRRNIAAFAKNAMGTVFLLAGAFFVCSTFLSIRAVFADPIAPTMMPAATNTASPRGGATSRASVRGTATSRSQAATTNTASRATAGTQGRNVVSRATPGVASRVNNAAAGRNVVARTTNRTTATRNVVSRTTPSRVSLSGSAIRGNKGAAATSTYTYLSSKLYTGNYSNIIDSTTGLISAEAYQNCLESYYTCMDEICTARSAAQGRCACAARVKSFIQAEDALETANEELIKASGELALLIANKGKDVSEAFQLTDAEKVMNCVSWQEANDKASVISSTNPITESGKDYDSSAAYMTDWCQNHGIYDATKCGYGSSPSYCSESGNNFGFDIKNIDGSSSDILASLQAWANSKSNTIKLLDKKDDTAVFAAVSNVSNIVSGIISTSSDDVTLDSLANTWGYELFQYAHNNVCGRVLDSCFNGIYEACGTPPTVKVNNSNGGTTTATLCANNATSNCPFNYNSKVAISASGDVTLNERGSTNATTSSSAACFGYTTTTTTNGVTTTSDPYSTLRGPVADARRSVMQKYLLDANASCDVYGDTLKKTAQNIGYQKIAAQQALQQKRLEFKNEEVTNTRNRALTAASNFKECMDEISECYETQMSSHGPGSSTAWTASRIKTYCAQLSNAPHCYEEMVCNPSTAQYYAVIDEADSTTCFNSQDYTKNSCRNVVTLSEILNKVMGAAETYTVNYETAASNEAQCAQGALCKGLGNSASIREQCLQGAGVDTIRDWKTKIYDVESNRVSCLNRNGTWNSVANECIEP